MSRAGERIGNDNDNKLFSSRNGMAFEMPPNLKIPCLKKTKICIFCYSSFVIETARNKQGKLNANSDSTEF